MIFGELILMNVLNLKDLVIVLELLIIAVLFLAGIIVTFRQTIGVKRTARKVMKGAMIAEFVTVLIWVCFAIQL